MPPFNGSGAFASVANSFNPAVATTTINSTDWAAILADLATALSTTYCKDGQSTPTANLPMGGFKFTGLGAGTGAGNSVRYEQVFLLSGTNAGDLLFTDATYDIGKVGATRPRDLFMSRNLTVGGTAAITGHVTLEGVTSTGATGTGAIVFGASPTLSGSPLAPTQTAGDNSTKIATTAYVDGSAGMVKLNSGSASGATLDIVMTSYTAYKNKVLVCNLIPATDGAGLRMQLSTNGGSSYDAGVNNYSYTVRYSDDVAGDQTTLFGLAPAILLTAAGIGNGANEGVSIRMTFFDMANTALWPRLEHTSAIIDNSATPRLAWFAGAAARRAAQDTDAAQLSFTVGNIASGTWTLYGYN